MQKNPKLIFQQDLAIYRTSKKAKVAELSATRCHKIGSIIASVIIMKIVR